MPLSTSLLAAHGRVLAALTGERDVTTGYADARARAAAAVPAVTTEVGSWRALVLGVRQAESARAV